MSDRELLELAAKAAGVTGKYSEWWEMGEQFYSGFREGRAWGAWNPLTNDGDVFGLAAQIGLIVNFPSNWCEPAVATYFDIEFSVPVKDGDIRAAVRRAIVLVAAEIGKSKL